MSKPPEAGTLVSAEPSRSGEPLLHHESAWESLQTGSALDIASVDAEPNHSAKTPKILLYSHDTFGLGNIQRTLLLTDALQQEYRNAAILIVTGSPVIHDFRIPEGVDYVKLPCVDRIGPDQYQPRFLTTLTAEIAQVRRAVLKDTVLGFAPDLMIVDKRAGGVDGELVDTLQTLRGKSRTTKLVLGVRDILDEPKRTRASLARGKFTMLVERYYDEVWIYGDRSLFDAVVAYGFSEAIARKSVFCGYLRRAFPSIGRREGPPRVLVTTGGGGDGSELIEAYLRGLSRLSRGTALQTTIVFGPQMPAARRRAILERFGGLPDVTFVEFEPDLAQRYASADVVVAMAGYSTVCDLLSLGRKAVLVPRAHPVREQLLRARLLTARGYFQLIEPHKLTGDRLMATVLSTLDQVQHPPVDVALDGLSIIRGRVRRLLKDVQ
jgi:predicted glycosyltransferase